MKGLEPRGVLVNLGDLRVHLELDPSGLHFIHEDLSDQGVKSTQHRVPPDDHSHV